MPIDDTLTFAFALAGAIGSIATAAALAVVWIQSRHTKKQTDYMREEMDYTLRPWIGVRDVQIESNEFVTLDVKNYGRIPGKVVRMKALFEMKKISKDILRSAEAKDYEVMLFPDGSWSMSSLPKEPKYQYVAAMIEYEYANNKHGEYGLVAKRIGNSGNFIYEEIFAN